MKTGESPIVTAPAHDVDGRTVLRMIAKRSFAVLATTSPAGRSHSAGVLYELADDALFINTMRSSRKARSIAANSNVAMCIPVRRLPVGPPSSIHFQASATVLATDDPLIEQLLAAGRLRSLTSHGELDLPDGCFVRITLPERVNTYGLGMSLRRLIADPLSAGGTATLRLATVSSRKI